MIARMLAMFGWSPHRPASPAPAPLVAPVVLVKPTLIEAPAVVIIPTAIATPTVAAAPVPVLQYSSVLTYAYPQAAGTAPSPYYYYGQQAAQSPGYALATTTGAYGQPAAATAASMPVYHTPTPTVPARAGAIA